MAASFVGGALAGGRAGRENEFLTLSGMKPPQFSDRAEECIDLLRIDLAQLHDPSRQSKTGLARISRLGNSRLWRPGDPAGWFERQGPGK